MEAQYDHLVAFRCTWRRREYAETRTRNGEKKPDKTNWFSRNSKVAQNASKQIQTIDTHGLKPLIAWFSRFRVPIYRFRVPIYFVFSWQAFRYGRMLCDVIQNFLMGLWQYLGAPSEFVMHRRIQGGGGFRGPDPPPLFLVASEEMHSIDFYSGSKKKKLKGGGGAIRNPKKNAGIDFYSGFRKTSQGGMQF